MMMTKQFQKSILTYCTLFSLFVIMLPVESHAGDKATPCAEVYLTGTGGGPAPAFGNAQASVFIRYGTTGTNCNDVKLQFDAGRGTLLKLSLIPAPTKPGFVTPQSLDALFLSHGHSDHTSSLPDILQTRWLTSKNDGQFNPSQPPNGIYNPLPVICFDITCEVVKSATALWQLNEIPRRKKSDLRLTDPSADIRAFDIRPNPQTVWEDDGISVLAVAVNHITGSVGFLVKTPAGDICISGDTSISENLIKLCVDAELIIHDVIHPVLGDIVKNPPKSDPEFIQIIDGIFNSHASAANFGQMDNIKAVMMLTHLTPPIGAGGFQGIPLIPYLNKYYSGRSPGPITVADYCREIKGGGYNGKLHVGSDLTKIELSHDAVKVIPYGDKITDCNVILSP